MYSFPNEISFKLILLPEKCELTSGGGGNNSSSIPTDSSVKDEVEDAKDAKESASTTTTGVSTLLARLDEGDRATAAAGTGEQMQRNVESFRYTYENDLQVQSLARYFLRGICLETSHGN